FAVAHSILSFVPKPDRRQFFAAISDHLAPSGCLYLFQAFRDGIDGSEVRFDKLEGNAFQQRAIEAYETAFGTAELPQFSQAVEDFVAARRGVLVSDFDTLVAEAKVASLVVRFAMNYQDGHKSANLSANRRTTVFNFQKGQS
ncbi:MAG: hypothetical protein AAFU69_14245, partial [Pseudomonadota bacterium]